MESKTLPNNTNNSQIFTILRTLIGFILLLGINVEQLFNGVVAPDWPIAWQIILFLQYWAINIGG